MKLLAKYNYFTVVRKYIRLHSISGLLYTLKFSFSMCNKRYTCYGYCDSSGKIISYGISEHKTRGELKFRNSVNTCMLASCECTALLVVSFIGLAEHYGFRRQREQRLGSAHVLNKEGACYSGDIVLKCCSCWLILARNLCCRQNTV